MKKLDKVEAAMRKKAYEKYGYEGDNDGRENAHAKKRVGKAASK
jgi:hypothetical protein